jgi:hypothetical protein
MPCPQGTRPLSTTTIQAPLSTYIYHIRGLMLLATPPYLHPYSYLGAP